MDEVYNNKWKEVKIQLMWERILTYEIQPEARRENRGRVFAKPGLFPASPYPAENHA